MWHHGYYSGFGMGGGSLMMILIFAVTGLLLYMILKQSTTYSNKDEKTQPIEIAKIRLAQGEITKEEFDELKLYLK